MSEAWQDDWRAFVDALAARIHSGATNEDLAVYFGGKSVTWSGVLDEKSIDELSPQVVISLPPIELAFGRRRPEILDGVCLPIARQSITAWDAIKIGTSVTFTAKLVGGAPVFSPIEVKQLSTGRMIVMIRLKDGELVAQSTTN
jgi:hypothetical protein